MPLDLTVIDEVKQLRRAGLRPSERAVRDIVRSADVAYAPLLELATDTELLHEEPPTCYGPIHALRLLGEMPRLAMIEPLLRTLPISRMYSDEELPALWLSDMPQMIARIGAVAVAPLWAIVDDEAWGVAARTAAIVTLGYLTVVAPEQHDSVVSGLRERLSASDDAVVNAYLLTALGDVGTQDVYAEAMQLYRAGKINTEILPPGTARQMLLTKRDGRLKCALHPLMERYEQHGPFEQKEEAQGL